MAFDPQQLVTLAEAKQHLRILDDHEDILIGTYINGSVKQAEDYLGYGLTEKWSGVSDVPASIKSAVLLMIDAAYNYRGDRPAARMGSAAERLLFPHKSYE